MPTTKQIVYVDASSLKSDSLCDRRYLLHIIRGYTTGSRVANYKAGYGTAFHAGLENYYAAEPKNRNTSLLAEPAVLAYQKYVPHIDTNPREFRSSWHLIETCKAYHKRYGVGDSLVPIKYELPESAGSILEKKFCHPYYEDESLVVFLTGTIDMVVDYFGRLVIVDHKSTGAYEIDRFFDEFRMNIQTQFYVRMFKELSGLGEYPPVIINGIFLKKPTQKVIDAGGFDGANFQRSQLIEYTAEQMEQFEAYLKWTLDGIVELAKLSINAEREDTGWLAKPNYAACHGRFSTCPFYDLCCQNDSLQLPILHSKYVKEEYNPLHFND